MNQYKYSASTNLRYLITLLPEYSNQGALPVDMIDISDEMAKEFFDDKSPEKKIRIPGANDLPCWGYAPTSTTDSLIAQADAQRKILRARAESEISWRQGAVDEGIAKIEEVSLLSIWIKYRTLLMRVDTSLAPNIDWPEVPV